MPLLAVSDTMRPRASYPLVTVSADEIRTSSNPCKDSHTTGECTDEYTVSVSTPESRSRETMVSVATPSDEI